MSHVYKLSYRKMFIALFLLFAVHRLLSFADLSESLPSTSVAYFKALLVGLASDFWVAGLGTACLAASEYLCSFFTRSSLWGWLRYALVLLVFFLLFVHHSYVQFFKFPVIIFHLHYMFDRDFIGSNFSSMFSFSSAIFVILSVLVLAIVHQGRSKRASGARPMVGLFLLGLALHVFNIKYRVQWFVPVALQNNLFESLYIQSRHNEQPKPLSAADMQHLDRYLIHNGIERSSYPYLSKQKHLEDLLLGSTKNIDVDLDTSLSLPVLMKKKVQSLIRSKNKPLILTVLSESLRAIDLGPVGKQASSLTPRIDQLAKTSLLFEQAWSVATVTRAGQEAIWCGYQGGLASSLMRNYPLLPIQCLPDLVNGFSFWHHGGEGQFDAQESFWRRHKVDHILSSDDFSKDSPRTSWGISDRVLMQESFKNIVQFDKTSQKDYLFGMVLTVTNHIPWQIPSDFKELEVSKPVKGFHPSEQTIRYTDYATGELTDLLKKAGLWDRTILLVIGDHGISASSLQHDIDAASAVQKSNVAFLMSGGIVEAIKEDYGHGLDFDRIRKSPVSQVDIASLLAYLLDVKEFLSMGEVPFMNDRKKPIIVDLVQDIYLPLQNKTFKRQELSSELSIDDGLKDEKIYYRAILELINLWSLTNRSKV